MESEAEAEPTSILQLQLLSLPPLKSPEPPWTFASPLHTVASVPFRWEEEPGKPRPCTALSLPDNNGVKCLELPPRLLRSESRMIKTPSPTTVLEGPYVGRSIFHSSSSLRFLRRRNYQDSFDCGSGGSSPERGLLGTMMLSEKVMSRDRGLFGSLRRRTFSFRGKREVVSMGRFVFPDKECGDGSGSERREAVKVTRVGRKRSLLGLSQARSHFWATIYGALKQVIPRRSTKWKKDGF
ncbi:hypothetical protein Nepgr_002239 [Nepenthes gracilis]|uniref:Uncharacterized protein n=1 Tax=Nepenthes gracilis TaxID=150966 RepID=A0AAD3P7K1_NEPGR|nr:hypothetical protein Nepgr_002239 [Nepenthes gracilis]